MTATTDDITIPVDASYMQTEGDFGFTLTATGPSEAPAPEGTSAVPTDELSLHVQRAITLGDPAVFGASRFIDLSESYADQFDTRRTFTSTDARAVTVSPTDTFTVSAGEPDFFHTIYGVDISRPGFNAPGVVASSTATHVSVGLPASLAQYRDPAGHGSVFTAEIESDNDTVDAKFAYHNDTVNVVVPFVLAPDANVPFFADVQDQAAVFYPYIQWMGLSGISVGTAQPSGPPLFEAEQPLTRQAMAAFLYRLSGETFDPGQTGAFADVSPASPFNTAIQWMASRGISTGTAQASGKPLYKPEDDVTRQDMAEFLARYRSADLSTPPESLSFADVPTTAAFASAISWLKSAGISTGTVQPSGLPLFKPLDAVTRQDMAAFLYRVTDPAAPAP